LFNTAYGVVKAGKPFSDYELICEIQVKNGLDLGEKYYNYDYPMSDENYRILMVVRHLPMLDT
jgi:hypothetical protein